MTETNVPLTVPAAKRREYLKNLSTATAGSGSLFLFAGDQKVEHLNADFVGRGIAAADASPEHLFQIAAASPIGVFATNLGLIAQYGAAYPKVPYLVKLNGRTNLYKNLDELVSPAWLDVADVVDFKRQSGLNILGVGYTVYLGGRQETKMLREAARIVNEAHRNGLLAVIWMYPRGAAIKEDDIHTIAGGAGVAAALGADFVKVKYPYTSKLKETAEKYREVIQAAGRTKVICVGGSKQEAKSLITQVWYQKTISGAEGLALGRNLHQRPLPEAIALATALALIINHDASLEDALAVYAGKKKIAASRHSSDFLGLF
jgi:fructose-bisphosphate aldolase/6-deoxy-5-ketofructose 1-phosphate synthase